MYTRKRRIAPNLVSNSLFISLPFRMSPQSRFILECPIENGAFLQSRHVSLAIDGPGSQVRRKRSDFLYTAPNPSDRLIHSCRLDSITTGGPRKPVCKVSGP